MIAYKKMCQNRKKNYTKLGFQKCIILHKCSLGYLLNNQLSPISKNLKIFDCFILLAIYIAKS